MEHIYLDHAATTPMHQSVLNKINEVMPHVYGNPSSIHKTGRTAKGYLESARHTMAESIGAQENEIIFTSSGTEADNLAVIGTALENKDKGKHVITTEQEHHGVLHAFAALEKEGFHVTYLPVQKNGKVSPSDVQQALTSETILVSIMHVNNETGVIQPIEEIGDVLNEHQAYFHIDAVQAFGLLEIDIKTLNADLLTASAHKIYGPKGVGFLYVQNDVPMTSLTFGGNQEHMRRAGTENMIGIIGFQQAAELVQAHRLERNEAYEYYKNVFLKTLDEQEIHYKINGDQETAIASILNISFPGLSLEALLMNLDLEGIDAASGSACTAGTVQESHVLRAMYGSEDDRAKNAIRFSFGMLNTAQNSEEAARRIGNIIQRMNRMEVET